MVFTMESPLILIEKKKKKLKLNIHLLKITKKLHGFSPRYNLRKKYMALILVTF